jgi:hypothetical protein
MKLDKPVVRARYEFVEAGEPTLGSIIDKFVALLVRKKGTR